MKHVFTTYFTLLTLLLLVFGPNSAQGQSPFLGTYPAGTAVQGGGTTITPASTPGNIVRVSATTSANFKGTLVVNPTTGVVRVSNAQPIGVYSVTLVGFNSLGGASQPRTFTLTVNKGPALNAQLPLVNTATIGSLSRPEGTVMGDIDNDGNLDLVIANTTANQVLVRLGNGRGSFSATSSIALNGWAMKAALGDLNNDGKLDVVVANLVEETGKGRVQYISICYGNGTGGFETPLNIGVKGEYIAEARLELALNDVNRDGRLDIITSTTETRSAQGALIGATILLNNSQGGFTTKEVGLFTGNDLVSGLLTGDVNGDGNLDLIGASYFARIGTRIGDGAGNFTARPDIDLNNIYLQGNSGPLANFTGFVTHLALAPKTLSGVFGQNAIPDLFVTGRAAGKVAIGIGAGGAFSGFTSTGFLYDTYTLVNDMAVADIDNDGLVDVLTLRWDEDPTTVYDNENIKIWKGDDKYNFTYRSGLLVGRNARSFALGDINNDGLLDIVVTNKSADNVSVILHTNTAPTITPSNLSRARGSSSQATIATVNDADTGPGSVTVTINGQASATVNGVTVSSVSNTNGTISANVSAACPASAASFTLTASDGIATTSVPFSVSVLSSLSIITQPVAASNVVAGANITANVSAISQAGSLLYQWYRNGQPVSGQTAATLSLTNVQTTDGGTYAAVVTDVCTSLTTTAFSLTVTPPFGITPLPVSVSRNGTTTAINLATLNRTNGNPANLNLTVTIGNGTSATNNGVTISNLTNTNGTVTADITTTCASSPADFVLTVSDGLSSTSATVQVGFIPTPLPLIINQPASSSTVEAGSTVTTSFEIRAGDPTTYQWYRGSTALRGQSSSTLTLTNVQASAAGNYYAVATTGCISVTSNTFSLSVTGSAANTITITPSEPLLLRVGEGKSVQDLRLATVSTTSGSPANLTVTINGSTSATLNGVSVTNLVNNNGSIQADLAASCGASAADFTLTATDGTLTSSVTVRISVSITLPFLTITSHPVPASSVQTGTSVTASVSAVSGNPINYQWYKDGQPVNGQASATLSLTNVRTNAAGSYVAVLTSTCQSVTSTAFSLSVNATPLSVTLTASPTTLLTTGTTTLSAVATGGMNQYSYTFTGPGTITPIGNTAVVSGLTAGIQTFIVSVMDATMPTAQTATATVSVTVNSVNTAPTTTGLTNQTATISQSFSLSIASAFTDAETPTALTLTASGLPTGLTLSGGVISGTPLTAGVLTVVITATDPGSLSISTSFTLTVQPASVSALTLTASASPSTLLTTGTTTLSAVVTGGTAPYSYAFTGPGTITTSGNTAAVSSLSVGVQSFSVLVADATTPVAQTASATVSVTVNSTNTAPTTTGIASQTATVGQSFSLNVASAFTDAQTPNALTLTATGLPGGLVLSNGLITGTPSTTGVSQVTVIATDPGSLTVGTTFVFTVSAPANTTTTVPFAITGVTAISCQTVTAGLRRVSFIPQYAGLTGQPVSFSVANELAATTQPGPYTLNLYTDNPAITLRAVQAGTQASFMYTWLAACSTTTPANRPPTVANAITNQTATQKQPFSFLIPANTFADADGDALTLSVSGLPQNLNFGDNRISGTPVSEGVSQVTVTANDGRGGMVSASFRLTIKAPTSATTTVPFAITGVTTVSCQTVTVGLQRVSFTPLYAGLTGQPVSFSVANELAATTQSGPYTLNLYTDNPSITLRAGQAGTQASFNYNWLAACGSTTPVNQTPTVIASIASQTATVNQPFSLVIPANIFTDDAEAGALSLTVSGLPSGLSYDSDDKTVSGTPTSATMITVTVRATDAGSLFVETSFVLTVSEPTNTTSTVRFSITGVTTVSCQTVTVGLRRISFTPQYAGLTGQPVSFSVANELSATTQAGPYTLNLYTDNPSITLRAVQSGTQASFTYNWLATCGNQANARVAVDQQTSLSVHVLGNPTADETVTVEVKGAAGQPLRLWVTDLQGHTVSQRSIEQAPAVGQYSLRLGGSAGNYLLRVSTPIQTNVVKIVRQ